MLSIEILDLGINNLKSLTSAIREVSNINVRIIQSDQASTNPDLLVLPGVGSYGTAMSALHDRGFSKLITSHHEKGGLLFGIYLGMQLLGLGSEETVGVKGLGLIPGQVKRLHSTSRIRVPNVGWSDVETNSYTSQRFQEFNKKDFYFVHSFYFATEEPSDTLFSATHGTTEFAAGIHRENVLGVQFHPEKSSATGMVFLNSVIGWASAKA